MLRVWCHFLDGVMTFSRDRGTSASLELLASWSVVMSVNQIYHFLAGRSMRGLSSTLPTFHAARCSLCNTSLHCRHLYR